MPASGRFRAALPGALSALLIATAAAGLAVAASKVVLRRMRPEHQAHQERERPLLEAAHQKARAAGVDPSMHAGTDDLKVIEGIGPRAEGVLVAAGIDTYSQLAEQRPGRLLRILKEAGGRMSDPRTWPEQARLAAAGEWERLGELQRQLARGRRRTAS